ncbi:MAG: prolipoprotein diacylglyceryl transferase [Myxococcales bacterium]|nr:prolipoprotein diacylglyceryl transferase [Myxococcales bacterium]MDH3484121.1 prolipoprotein diacylglyceryl transferase [Myxococcales bacterium]
MHPILFSIPTPWGAIPIYSYGVMLGSSLLFAWYFLMYMGKRVENFNRELLASCFTWTAVGAIAGARLLYVFTNLDSFDSIVSWFDLRSGGLVAYGGFLGGFLTAWAFWRMKKIPLLPFADLAVPTLGSGLLMTRIGCYLYGCDYGRPLGADAPGWLARAGTFPKWDTDAFPVFACDGTISGAPAYQHHLELYPDEMVGRVASLPVHPTQIYESTAGLLLFVFAVWLLLHRRFRGQVFLSVAGLYALWRFLIEYLRDDPERGFAFGFSTSQLISLAVIPVCIIAYVHLKKRAAEVGDVQLPEWALDSGPQPAAPTEAATDDRPAKYRPKKIKKRK